MWRTEGNRYAAIEAAEIALLSPEVRREGARLDELLHADFVEIGRSGRRWTREAILEALRTEEDHPLPATDDWQYLEVAPGVVLVTYRIRSSAGDSRHSSIWDTTSGAPEIRFHQGTALPDQFEDREARSRALRLCVLLWAREGREQDLHRYEDSVLALLSDHAGRVVARDRILAQGTDDPTEVQIIEFRDQDAMDAYLGDPRRSALHDARDAAIAKTQILRSA